MKSLFEKEERYWSGKFDADDSLSFLPYSQSSKLYADGEAVAEPGLLHRTLPSELGENHLPRQRFGFGFVHDCFGRSKKPAVQIYRAGPSAGRHAFL